MVVSLLDPGHNILFISDPSHSAGERPMAWVRLHDQYDNQHAAAATR